MFLIGDHNSHLFTNQVTVNGTPVRYGLIPRDYTKHPVGSLRGIKPFSAVSMPLIPRSEWSARCAEQTKQQSSLSHIRKSGNNGNTMVVLDQNGQGYCTTEDTEVLTEKGFVPWPSYNGVDALGTVNQLTGRLEFQHPLERQVFRYKGEMIYSTNRRIDFGVTPNHRMLVRKWDEAKRTLAPGYTFVQASDMGWYCGLPHAPSGWLGTEITRLEVPGDQAYDGDDFFALLGLIVSDGYAGGSDNTRNWVSFASFRESSREDIAALARRNGFHESPGRPGVWVRYNARALAEWIRTHCYSGECKAQNKRVPSLVKVASMRQIQHFLTYFNDRNRKGDQFYSSSKQLIDDLQELFLRLGKRSHIGERDAKDVAFAGNKNGVIRSGRGYVLTVGAVDRLCLDRKKHIATDRYNGYVFCATVPNGTLVTRRNGSVLISGNCWAYSSTMATMMARAVMGMPYVRLSAHSVACVIKSFRDEGGWGAASAQFISERGVAPVSHWAEKSMSRSHNTTATWAEAAKYKLSECWVETDAALYDRSLTFEQFATGLLLNNPGVGDFNWWGHSVCLLSLVDGRQHRDTTRTESGKLANLTEYELMWGFNTVGDGFGVDIANSWTPSWGEDGCGVLTGNKAVPDGGLLVRNAIAA